jgi:hypothetical protein
VPGPSHYPGVTLEPVEVAAYTLPAAELHRIRDCIYCFPVETGLPPLYIALSSPYQGSTVGIYSGRPFDLEQAGGPILELDWRSANVTQDGIDRIIVHTSRFEQSDANDIMIDRLKKILLGVLAITDTDKRFYTHELRELERYRALNIPDGANPLDGTWNNTHTASLEDYKIGASFDLLYTPEAVEADNQQMQKDYP